MAERTKTSALPRKVEVDGKALLEALINARVQVGLLGSMDDDINREVAQELDGWITSVKDALECR